MNLSFAGALFVQLVVPNAFRGIHDVHPHSPRRDSPPNILGNDIQRNKQVWLSVREETPYFGVRWLQNLLDLRPDLVHRALQLDERDDWDMLSHRNSGERDSFLA